MFLCFTFIKFSCFATQLHTRTHTTAHIHGLLPVVVVVTSNFYPPPFIPSLSSAQKDVDDDDDKDEDEDKGEVEHEVENENDADTSAM